MDIYFNGNKQVFADIKGFTVKTDQAQRAGGNGEFLDPFNLFLSSLGTCAGVFVKGFCDSRGISTEKIHLTQNQQYDTERKMLGKVDIQFHVPVDFPEKYEGAVIQSANLCAVKRHLKEEIDINVSVVRAN